MPRKKSMSWEGHPGFRWKKMFKGTMYRVSCKELGLPPTEWTEANSLPLANAWWEKKLAELLQVQHKPEAANKIKDLEKKIAWAAANDPSLLNSLENVKGEVEEHGNGMSYYDGEFPLEDFDRIKNTLDLAARHGIKIELPDYELPPELLQNLFGEGKVWAERLKTGARLERDFTLSYQAEQFLALEQARGKKPRTFGELSESIRKIIITMRHGDKVVLHPSMDVRKINKDTVTGFYMALKSTGRDNDQQKKLWGFFKRLIRFLWANELIELPRNLEERTFTFGTGTKKIKTWSVAEVKACLAKLSPRLRLYALLGLNCGMLGVDMANLRPDELDMKKGRIRRKRTKTETQKDVPEVDYKLWKTTAKLLALYQTDAETVLTSKAGTKLVEHWIDENGKEREKDLIRQQWKKGKPKPTLPLKAFRTVGASIIANATEHGGKLEYTRYYHHYLAHSPKSIADKHYAPPSRELFDEILTWLGGVVGVK